LDPAMAEAFRQIPYGIYVLIARKGKDIHSLIVSWVSQVSYSPPMLMVALRRNRKALPALRETGLFSVSLFKREQKPLVVRFKESPPEAEPSIYAGEGGPDLPPILKGSYACWQCRLVSTMEAGDHILCLGEVTSAFAIREGEPLTTLEYGKTYIGQF
jgi:flavin reductase (DIM6/NTAB) family NADH-FMN oxidoreductase RutF